MSACGGMIRNQENLESALKETEAELDGYLGIVKSPAVVQLPAFYRLHDMLISQKAYLFAMLDYVKSGGGSRGYALYTDKDGRRPDIKLPELYRCRLDQGAHEGVVQEILWKDTQCVRLNGALSVRFRRLIIFLKISGKHIGIGKNLRIFKQAIFVNSISNTWCREDYKNRAKIVDI